ncbi:MAG: tetratricopeptide repeat protein [Bryobacteraceae bacterium]
MKSLKIVALLCALLVAAGCSRDPDVLKKKYVENGNKYFANGKYKEASILYRKALSKDARYGEAYARLAETEVRLGRFAEAVRAYQRAVELQADNTDVASRLANIYMAAYVGSPNSEYLRQEIQNLQNILSKKNANSFEALRLAGFVATVNKNFPLAAEKLRAAEKVKPNQPEVALALAQALVGAKQDSEAEKVVRATLDNNKGYAALYDMLSALYVKQNRIADAEKVLQEKVANNPKEIAWRIQLAGFYYAIHRPDDMNKTIQDVMSNAKGFPTAYQKVGDFFMRARDFERAQKTYEQGLQANPTERLEYQKRVIEAMAAAGKNKEAMALAEKMLAENKDNADLRAIRAGLILQMGERSQLQRAIDDFASALQKNPKNFVLQYNIGRAYYAKGDLDAARVQFQEALKLRPDYMPARLLLAQVFLTKREYAKAIQTAGEVLQVDPSNLQARLIKSAALIGSGELPLARKELEETSQAYPGSRDAQFQMALLNLADHKTVESEKMFRSLQQSDTRDPRGLLGLVETYMATGRMKEAQQVLTDELTRQPARDDIRLALANVSYRAGSYSVAIENYKKLLEKRSDDSQMWLRLGIVYGRDGKFSNAHESYSKALSINPNDPVTTVEQAMLYEAEGKRQQAVPLYNATLKLQPDNPVALNNLAFIMAEDGRDLDQALTYSQRAKQKLPTNVDIADTLGWVYIKKNLSDNAIEVFRDLTAKQPQNATFRYHLALALVQKGDKGQARRELDVALRAKPQKPMEDKIRELMSRIG